MAMFHICHYQIKANKMAKNIQKMVEKLSKCGHKKMIFPNEKLRIDM
jgi:hypothetical protein